MSAFEDRQFRPGEGGRKLGSRNKLSHKFIADVLREWEAHGAEVLKILRIESPEAFAKLAATLIPREYEGNPPIAMIFTGVSRGDELPPPKPLALPAPPLPEPRQAVVRVQTHQPPAEDEFEW